MFLWYPVMDLARAPRRTARKKGSGYENAARHAIYCNTQPRSQGFSVRTRRDTRKPWSGPVTWRQKMAVFDSYSSRSGEIFFDEIYKSSKQINRQKTSQSILFMCRAKFGTNQLKSILSKIYRYFWRFSTTGKAASKLHLGVSMQVVIHTKFAFSRLEQYDYCYN
jgi:hypothetical protein